MGTITERFIEVFDDLVSKGKANSIRQVCLAIGLKPSQASEGRSGKRTIPNRYAEDLQTIYGVNKTYILEGTGDIYINKDHLNRNHEPSGKDLGEITYPIEPQETPFIDLGDGQYIMIVPLVNEYAHAGYLSGFKDMEYLDELPKHTITVMKHHRGLYRAFEVLGDSMSDGTDESIKDGSVVTGRSLMNHHWASKLNYKRYRFWIIVHKTDGILTKEIVNHDVNTGNITLRSLNPDKDSYPDIVYHLDDIRELYNIVHVGKSL
jgi:hypothetical protein